MSQEEIDAFIDNLTDAEVLLLRSWQLQARAAGRAIPTIAELKERLEKHAVQK